MKCSDVPRKKGLTPVEVASLVLGVVPLPDVERTRAMTLPVFDTSLSDDELDAMMDNATLATNFLKAIGHEGRLMILCHLATGEKSVTELEELLSARQAAVSQQLGRLRLEGLVKPRREGKTIYYSLADERCKRIISVVYDLFCKTD
jgi:DNA-binding transcriptional ArsR family regulator